MAVILGITIKILKKTIYKQKNWCYSIGVESESRKQKKNIEKVKKLL